jgi:hypothetical protein
MFENLRSAVVYRADSIGRVLLKLDLPASQPCPGAMSPPSYPDRDEYVLDVLGEWQIIDVLKCSILSFPHALGGNPASQKKTWILARNMR